MIDAFDVVSKRKAEGKGPRLVCGLTGLHPDYMALIHAYSSVVDHSFGVSPLTTRAIVELCGIPCDRVEEIPTGIADRTHPRIERSGSPLRLGFVGRLVADKRPLDIAKLTYHLMRSRVSYSLDVFGEGELRADLSAALGDSLGNTVHLHGEVSPDHLYQDVYPRLDAVLFFSAAEGNPNALLEAMSNGVVAVCSDFAGRREQGLIRHGETGLVFPVGDAVAASHCIEMLDRSDDLRRSLSERGRQEVLANYSLSAMGKRFAAMLDRSLAQERRTGTVEINRGMPASRLDRALGPRLGEWIRSMARYRFPHQDLEEWPSTESVRGELANSMEASLAAWLER
jgi:glycosyltransferase involved in cell wall biosynthesis